MDGKLVNKAFCDFYNGIPEDGSSMSMVMRYISENIPKVAQSLSVAKLDVALFAPCTAYDVKGKNEQLTVYSEKEYEEIPCEREYITGENGKVRVSAYPAKGVVWTDEEKTQVDFLLKNIYFISGRARMQEIMSKMVVLDSLTGLPNTPGLIRYCSMLLSEGKLSNYTAVFINLKKFKYVNQRVGSEGGDDALCKYAQIVRSLLEPQEMFARMGGDNFFALIKDENLQAFLDEIANIPIRITYKHSIITVDLSPKIGIYPIKLDDSLNDMMDNSSLALAEAKNSITQDVVWFEPYMLEDAVHKKEISSNFAQAIQDREFLVYYQPKILLDDNSLYGGEALVRWGKNGQMVPPMEFIPVLEQEGFICMLDFYVLDAVCRDIRNWLDAGIKPVRISVNFSKIHLYNKNLARDIADVLDKYELDSSYIEIELTETTGYEDLSNLNAFLNAMRAKGISTSLDDFGTGYSSLNLLKNLDVDVIKLDRAFLANLEESNPSDEVIIKNIVKMIKDLKMEVVAEGVETSAQADYLRSIDCHLAQGFLFDKPLPHDMFEKCLTGEKTYNV